MEVLGYFEVKSLLINMVGAIILMSLFWLWSHKKFHKLFFSIKRKFSLKKKDENKTDFYKVLEKEGMTKE